MNVGETVTYCVEGFLFFYVGAFLGRLCVPTVFGVRAGLVVNASPVALREGVVDVRGAKAYVGYEAGLPLYSMAVAMSGVGSAPQLLEQNS